MESMAKMAQAVALRRRGYTFEEIARELHYGNRMNAHRAVIRGLRLAMRDAGSEELRELESQRCLEIIRKHWETATTPPPAGSPHNDIERCRVSLGAVCQAMRMHMELRGLRAPVKVEASGPGGQPLQIDLRSMTDDEVLALARRLDPDRG